MRFCLLKIVCVLVWLCIYLVWRLVIKWSSTLITHTHTNKNKQSKYISNSNSCAQNQWEWKEANIHYNCLRTAESEHANIIIERTNEQQQQKKIVEIYNIKMSIDWCKLFYRFNHMINNIVLNQTHRPALSVVFFLLVFLFRSFTHSITNLLKLRLDLNITECILIRVRDLSKNRWKIARFPFEQATVCDGNGRAMAIP